MATPFYSPKREASGASSDLSVHGKPTLVRPFLNRPLAGGPQNRVRKPAQCRLRGDHGAALHGARNPHALPGGVRLPRRSRLKAVWTSAGAFKGTSTAARTMTTTNRALSRSS